MRIVSLVPSATETLFALGAGDDIVAVTHECDHPSRALEAPKVTRDMLRPGLTAREIDAAVRERTLAGQAIYELDEQALRHAQPDLIVTQELCPVCAVAYDDVIEIARHIESGPRVIALDPRTLGEVLDDVRTVARAIDREAAGEALVARAADRIEAVRAAVDGAAPVGVVAVEWFDPIYVAGHWTPQLIEYAGGIDLLGRAGERSETATWEELAAAAPQVLVAMPCGYDAERSQEEAYDHADELAELGAGRIVAVNAAGLFSRPGPRLIDGLELLAHLLHPDRVGPPPRGSWLPVEVDDPVSTR